MNVQKPLTKRQKIIVIVFIAAVILILGITRPYWSVQYKETQGTEESAEELSGSAGEDEDSGETVDADGD